MPSPDVTPVSDRSGIDIAASLAGPVLPVVTPAPSVGQVGAGAEEAPSGVAEQMTAGVTPLPTLERTGPLPVLVAPSAVGAAPQVEVPASQVEVATTAPSQEQSDAATVVYKGAAKSVPPTAQATTLDVGRTEEDVAGGSPTLTS